MFHLMLSNRYVYTHSEFSSSLSSISSISSENDDWKPTIIHITSLIIVATNAGLSSTIAVFPHQLSYLQTLTMGGTQWSTFLISRHITSNKVTQLIGTLLASLALFVLSLNQPFWILLLVQGITLGLGLGLNTFAIELDWQNMVMSAGIGGCVLSVLVNWLLLANDLGSVFGWLTMLVLTVNMVGILALYWVDRPLPVDSAATLINYMPTTSPNVNYWYEVSMLLYSLGAFIPLLATKTPWCVPIIFLGAAIGCLAHKSTVWLLPVPIWFLWLPLPYVYVAYGVYGAVLGGSWLKVNEVGVLVGCMMAGCLLDKYQEMLAVMVFAGSISSLASALYFIGKK